MKYPITYGSVCSGIEAAQLAFKGLGFDQLWSSEIAVFPSNVLKYHYPCIQNIGDMNKLPSLIRKEQLQSPDIFCGGTPCQAFSLAGLKNGLADERGMLSMTFIDIANEIDVIRKSQKKEPALILWENVEGILNDKTNAFGNFIAGLAGYESALTNIKWPKAGCLFGKSRNVAWRVLDSKYFGLPHQRRRLYVLAGGKDTRPDHILFEYDNENQNQVKSSFNNKRNLYNENDSKYEFQTFFKDGIKYEFFRSYTDCLYSAYGTKWNGNAAAYNGSLFVVQDNRIRRFTPLECERLMGFPDNYTKIDGQSDTSRYKAIGASWPVPVVKWIAERISNQFSYNSLSSFDYLASLKNQINNHDLNLFLLGNVYSIEENFSLNTSEMPNNPIGGNLFDIIQSEVVDEKFFLSSKACKGILRRKEEKDINMNTHLARLMKIASDF